MIKLRAALVALAAIALAVTAACSARPAYAASTGTPQITSVRIWRHVVGEPGTLGITVRTSGCMTSVIAYATRHNAIRYSDTATGRGHVFTLYVKFPRGVKTGRWAITSAYAYPCDNRLGIPMVWEGSLGFNVHAPQEGTRP
jgi:hypothetical protein